MSVEYLHLPDTEDKTGLDDYLMSNGHIVEDLWALVKPAPPPVAEPRNAMGERSEPQRVPVDDARIAQFVAETELSGRFCWCGSLGWMRYTKTHWERTTDAAVNEQVRLAVIELHATEARQGADADRLKSISALFAAHRIRAITGLAKGILEVRAEEFDAHPDLLNVNNGVIDLRTGERRPARPGLCLLTKCAPHKIDYKPGATHPTGIWRWPLC